MELWRDLITWESDIVGILVVKGIHCVTLWRDLIPWESDMVGLLVVREEFAVCNCGGI